MITTITIHTVPSGKEREIQRLKNALQKDHSVPMMRTGSNADQENAIQMMTTASNADQESAIQMMTTASNAADRNADLSLLKADSYMIIGFYILMHAVSPAPFAFSLDVFSTLSFWNIKPIGEYHTSKRR
ncbi:hypothetical protein VSK91_18800 [Bacillus swezeyi]|uniref:hypothetical protein n=1 Tax=Bacillus swezeyi TaxID=1925020 RepID=UPI0039C63F02